MAREFRMAGVSAERILTNLNLYDLETVELVRSWPHPHDVSDVLFFPDDLLLCTSSHDGSLRTWDTSSGAADRSRR